MKTKQSYLAAILLSAAFFTTSCEESGEEITANNSVNILATVSGGVGTRTVPAVGSGIEL